MKIKSIVSMEILSLYNRFNNGIFSRIMLFILLTFSTSMSAQETLNIVDIPGREIIFVRDMDSDNHFNQMIVFQYSDSNASFLSGSSKFRILEYSDTEILLQSDRNETIIFSIRENDNRENVFMGYGIQKLKGFFRLHMDYTYPVVSYDSEDNEKQKPNNFDCDSGGEGASGCAVGDDSPIVGESCSVSCKSGYYACCDASLNECKCFNQVTHEPYDKPITSPPILYSY